MKAVKTSVLIKIILKRENRRMSAEEIALFFPRRIKTQYLARHITTLVAGGEVIKTGRSVRGDTCFYELRREHGELL